MPGKSDKTATKADLAAVRTDLAAVETKLREEIKRVIVEVVKTQSDVRDIKQTMSTLSTKDDINRLSPTAIEREIRAARRARRA